MKKWVLILMVTFVFLQLTIIGANASEIMDKFAIRITIIENGTIHEWEYDSPDKFEYEIGSEVFRGERAEKEVKAIVSLLSLSEDSHIEEMLSALEEKFPKLEHLDARMRSASGQLHTWVWSKG